MMLMRRMMMMTMMQPKTKSPTPQIKKYEFEVLFLTKSSPGKRDKDATPTPQIKLKDRITPHVYAYEDAPHLHRLRIRL